MLSHAAHRPADMGRRHLKHRRNMEAILSGLVSLLHEAGKLVLVEGVETEHEAQTGARLQCADFVQGFFFGRPNPGRADACRRRRCISELTERYRDADRSARTAQCRAGSRRTCGRFERAAERLAAGEPLEEVCWNFLALDHAARCFLLDANGRRRGATSCCAPIARRMKRAFCRSLDAQGANWLRRPYFRDAINAPERVHVTRPYLSINEALPCVTLSVETRVGEQTCVLCGDIDWVDEEQY